MSEQEPTEFNQTGLRSSDIDYESMSYSDLSSAARTAVTDERSGLGSNLTDNVIYGTDINIGQVMENFKKFILEFKTITSNENFITDIVFNPLEPLYMQKLKEMSMLRRSWINIDCTHINNFDNRLLKQLIKYPKEVIPAMDEAISLLYRELYKIKSASIQTRPYNCEQSRELRNLNPEDLQQLVTLNGLVIRQSPLIPEMITAYFTCQNVTNSQNSTFCQNVTVVPCERGRIMEPDTCSKCNANYTQKLVHNFSPFIDKQMLKLQESPDDIPHGETSKDVTLYCYQDLFDTVQPGDRVIVTGIYRSVAQRESPNQRVIKSTYNTYVDVLHFQKSANRLRDEAEHTSLTKERIEKIQELSLTPDLYDRLSSAIAPSIYGNELVKKGLLLMLFGGRVKENSDSGTGTRANIHILLCGDPGTAKSQLLQYVHKLTPRSQYTSGKGSSKVGLTAYITRDLETRSPTLQGGALALADNGVCCIDEFDKMSDTTRSVLHEVMEQQTLSIAKAGVICQLNARTSVLAAANPVGSCWDAKKTIIENIQLPPTLMSRFDLIFLMLDTCDPVYDARLARHVIGLFMQNEPETVSGAVEYEMLRDYISYAKENIDPEVSYEGEKYLIAEYVSMRRAGNAAKGQISAYPRQLESLIRLSEAHARMRLSTVATIDDCKVAVELQRAALKQSAVDPLTGLVDVNILTTGVTGGYKKRKEEMARAIYDLLEERRVVTFTYQKVLEDLRDQSDRMITRELFEDGLNLLKADNKIDWSGKTIRKR